LSNRNLYKFSWDCGRAGEVDGLLTATPEQIAGIVGKGVYFGEILGKHSEVYGLAQAEEFTLVTDDQTFIAKMEELFAPPFEDGDGPKCLFGYSPFDYLEEIEDDEPTDETDEEVED